MPLTASGIVMSALARKTGSEGRAVKVTRLTQSGSRPHRAMVRLVVSPIPAIRRWQISAIHSTDQMPRGSMPRFEAT
jgi:hypothetical protein